MNIELPADLAEQVADWLGIYGHCDQQKCKEDFTCCRTGFAPYFTERIQCAVLNEQKLDALDLSTPQL
jgi:hypothetical protein